MSPPRYKPRSHYRTRRSAREHPAIDASVDFGPTTLERAPAVVLAALEEGEPPADSEPSARGTDARRCTRAQLRLIAVVAVGAGVCGALTGVVVALLG